MTEDDYRSMISPMVAAPGDRFKEIKTLIKLDLSEGVYPIIKRTDVTHKDRSHTRHTWLMLLDGHPPSEPPQPLDDVQVARGTKAVKAMCAIKFCELHSVDYDPFRPEDADDSDDDGDDDGPVRIQSSLLQPHTRLTLFSPLFFSFPSAPST